MTDVFHWILQPDLTPLLGHGQVVFLGVVAAIIFVETGLLVGFLLPGDSLLFSAGLVAALGGSPHPAVLALTVLVAAYAGDQVGYLIGKRTGPALYRRPNGRLIKRDYIDRSHAFFERHGGRAVVLARFIPIVRTFTPVIAGVASMRYRTFVLFNFIGAAGWAVTVSMLGFVLGKQFPGIEHYLTPAIVVIVCASLTPAVISAVRARRGASSSA